MNQGRAVFSLLISFLPEREFRGCVGRYQGDISDRYHRTPVWSFGERERGMLKHRRHRLWASIEATTLLEVFATIEQNGLCLCS